MLHTSQSEVAYCDEYVSLSVCLSTTYLGKHKADFHQILRMFSVAMARPSSDGVAIRYVLSGFVDDVVFS